MLSPAYAAVLLSVQVPDHDHLLLALQIGIILSSLGVLTLSTFDFLQIVELLNIVYCLAELMEFAAFLYLRYKVPNLYRYDTPLLLVSASML